MPSGVSARRSAGPAVRILATLLAPDAGKIQVAGLDVQRERGAVRNRISLTGQSVAVDDLQTAWRTSG